MSESRRSMHIIMGTSMFSSASWQEDAFSESTDATLKKYYPKWCSDDDFLKSPEHRNTELLGSASEPITGSFLRRRLKDLLCRQQHDQIAKHLATNNLNAERMRYCAEMSTLIAMWCQPLGTAEEQAVILEGEFQDFMRSYSEIKLYYNGDEEDGSEAYHCAAQLKSQIEYLLGVKNNGNSSPAIALVKLCDEFDKAGIYEALKNMYCNLDGHSRDIVLTGGYKVLIAMMTAAHMNSAVLNGDHALDRWLYLHESGKEVLEFTPTGLAKQLALFSVYETQSEEDDLCTNG